MTSKNHPVKAYWWREIPNFGDALAPLLLARFAELKTEWDTISHAHVASIGSILEHIPPLWDGYILGSGKLLENSRLHIVSELKSGVTAKILALRGPLTAKGIPGNYALGDPGILADALVGYQKKMWDLGIVPHWQDKELAAKFTALIHEPHTVKVINPGDDTLDVLRQIGACHKIVTSSLHGMITADAFNIPRRVEICPAMEKDGGTFKFRDYSASIRTPFETGKVIQVSRFYIEDSKFEMYDAYRALRDAINKER